MNVVLFSRDMEPITVVDVPFDLLEAAKKWGRMRLPVFAKPCCVPMEPTDAVPEVAHQVVNLELHRFPMPAGKDGYWWGITVDSDELALALRPSWLPGQRGEINRYEQRARAMSALLVEALSGRLSE